MGFKFQIGMGMGIGMGMKSLKFEGIGTKNLKSSWTICLNNDADHIESNIKIFIRCAYEKELHISKVVMARRPVSQRNASSSAKLLQKVFLCDGQSKSLQH